MRIKILSYTILLSFFLCSGLYGQSLYKDAHHLAESITSLQKIPDDLSDGARDSLKIITSAQILAILDHYWQWSGQARPAGGINSASKILAAYAENQALNPVLESLQLGDQVLPELLETSFQQQKSILAKGPRENILQLLNSNYVISPLEHLSVAKTLRDYQQPPISNLKVLKAAAETSNRNVKKGIVNQTAIIMGLFNFLIERAQEEVVITFLERLLGEKGIAQLKEVFPNTVFAFGDKAFTYSESFLDRLREALYEDLQHLSVSLPQLLSNPLYFDLLENDPIVYNFLQLYTMVAMGQQGVPITEIVPLTFRNLHQRYLDEKKTFNLKLAANYHTSDQYKKIPSTTDEIIQLILSTNNDLRKRETKTREALEELFDEGDEDVFVEELMPQMDEPYQSIFTILDKDPQYPLELVPSLLNAKLNPEIVDSWSTLKSYDKFLRNPLSEQQMRAAGLALARQLNDPWYEKMTLGEMLRQWQKDLVVYQNALGIWQAKSDPEGQLKKEKKAYDTAREALITAIKDTKVYYELDAKQEEKLALDVLQRITESIDIFQGQVESDAANQARKGQIEIKEVEARLAELNDKLQRTEAAKAKTALNPVATYFQNQKAEDPFKSVLEKIGALEKALARLETELTELDNSFAVQEVDALKNISPLVQITGVLSQLMYTLRSDQADKQWISEKQLNELLFSETLRPAFLGLLTQQLDQVKVAGRYSLTGISNLIGLTIRDLTYLAPPAGTTVVDSLSFFRKAAFATITLNRLLEFPLFIDPTQPDQTISLIDKHPKLAPIPELSNQALDLIYYTNIKDHRHAMSSLIRLFTDIAPIVVRPPKNPSLGGKKTKRALNFFDKYGNFAADLIDADSSQQVQDLLEGISDPPGSSRVKRREPFTANINGYVGGSIGQETLEGAPLSSKEEFTSFAPTIPVGLSFSKLIGRGKKSQSFSLFLSIIDLGSLMTFSFDSEIEGENQLSFKNVLKPGLQLHWNIKNSPFFMGVGGQWGPQFREFNGEQKQLNSARIFLNFGVDVVIKRLY